VHLLNYSGNSDLQCVHRFLPIPCVENCIDDYILLTLLFQVPTLFADKK